VPLIQIERLHSASLFPVLLERAIDAVRREWPPLRFLLAYGALLSTLAVWSGLAIFYDRFPGDLEITRAVQDIDVQALRSAMRFSTDLTSPVWSAVTMTAIVLGWLLARQPRFAFFTLATLSSHLLGGILKLLVDRPRPDPDLVRTVRFEEALSYPSGHVEWVVAVEGFCLFAVFLLTRNPIVRGLACAIWLVHLALTSAGRVDQGLHWPSDIVASWMVGASALLLVIWAYKVSLRVFPLTEETHLTLGSSPRYRAEAGAHSGSRPPMDDSTFDRLISNLEQAVLRVEAIARDVPPERWDDVIHTDEAAWTRRQLLAHMAANDLRQLVRVRVGAGVELPGDPEALTAEQRLHEWNQAQVDLRRERGIGELLDEMRANRTVLIGLLRGLSREQRARPMPFRGTPTPLDVMVETLIAHLDAHAGELAGL
jgi:undecaprenyl-diphosphatase